MDDFIDLYLKGTSVAGLEADLKPLLPLDYVIFPDLMTERPVLSADGKTVVQPGRFEGPHANVRLPNGDPRIELFEDEQFSNGTTMVTPESPAVVWAD